MKIQLKYVGTNATHRFSSMWVALDAPPRMNETVVLNACEYWVYRVVWCPLEALGQCYVELMAFGEGEAEF